MPIRRLLLAAALSALALPAAASGDGVRYRIGVAVSEGGRVAGTESVETGNGQEATIRFRSERGYLKLTYACPAGTDIATAPVDPATSLPRGCRRIDSSDGGGSGLRMTVTPKRTVDGGVALSYGIELTELDGLGSVSAGDGLAVQLPRLRTRRFEGVIAMPEGATGTVAVPVPERKPTARVEPVRPERPFGTAVEVAEPVAAEIALTVERVAPTTDAPAAVRAPIPGRKPVPPAAAQDARLLQLLDGVPPRGSLPLASVTTLPGGDGTAAWSLGERMFVRTRLEIISPQHTGKTVGADGVRAYELAEAPIVVASDGTSIGHIRFERERTAPSGTKTGSARR